MEFIKNLNKIVKTNEEDMERIDNNVAIRRNRPIVIQKEKVIADLQWKLSHGQINPLTYKRNELPLQNRFQEP